MAEDGITVVATRARRTATLQGQRTDQGLTGTLLGAPRRLSWTAARCSEHDG